MIFLLFHLLLQVHQQSLILPLHGESDRAEVKAGGFQSQGVQGQEPRHSLAVGERAEEDQREVNDRIVLTHATTTEPV